MELEHLETLPHELKPFRDGLVTRLLRLDHVDGQHEIPQLVVRQAASCIVLARANRAVLTAQDDDGRLGKLMRLFRLRVLSSE